MLGAALLACLWQVPPPAQGTPSPERAAERGAERAAELAAKIATCDDALIEPSLAELARLGEPGAAELVKLTEHPKLWVRFYSFEYLHKMHLQAGDRLPHFVERLVSLSRPEHGSLVIVGAEYEGALDEFIKLFPRADFHQLAEARAADPASAYLPIVERALLARAILDLSGSDVARLLELVQPHLSMAVDLGWDDLPGLLLLAATKSKDVACALVEERFAGASPTQKLGLLALLAGTGKAGSALWPLCLEQFGSSEAALRALALEVLGNARNPEIDDLRARLKRLEADPSPMVRLELARVLAWCTPDDEIALRSVCQLVDRGEPAMRLHALHVWSHELIAPFLISRMLQESKAILPRVAVPVLLRALRAVAPAARADACLLLGTYAKEAAAALPALRTLLKDPDALVRKRAEYAVWAIEGNRDTVEIK